MSTFLWAFLGGILPALLWLWFWLREDETRPEPKPLIGKIFLFGCLAIIPAYFLEKSLGASSSLAFLDNLFWMVILLAVIEESLKYSAVYVGALKTRFYDEPVDAMIYMIAAALGFAAIENVLVNFGAVFSNNMEIKGVIAAMTLRFVGATLLHALSSGVVGYFWANRKIIIGLIFATLLHAFFNYFIILFDRVLLYPTLFLIIIAMFVFWDFEKLKRIIK